MSTLILIHGGWHGAWCWQRIVPGLEQAGHHVIARDLPSMGDDKTDPRTITLDVWAQFVVDLIPPGPEPVVLVAHSRGGAVASRAAELAPERIKRLVYVAAFMLPAGRSVAETSREDAGSLLVPNMVTGIKGITCTIRPEVLRNVFYARCSAEDQEFAAARVGPEPLKPLITKLKLSAERYGSVPRTYIECTHDRAITLSAQRRMQAELPCDTVHTLATDHSPFFSKAPELVTLLAGV